MSEKGQAMGGIIPPGFRFVLGLGGERVEKSAIKKLSEMTDIEWGLYHWEDVTTPSDPERVYLRGLDRTPEEAVKARADFNEWLEMKKADLGKRHE